MNSKTVLDGSKSFLIKMENWAVFKQYSSSCNQRKIYKWHSNFREILQKNNTKKEHFNFCTLRRASRPCFFKMLRCKIFGFQDLGRNQTSRLSGAEAWIILYGYSIHFRYEERQEG